MRFLPSQNSGRNPAVWTETIRVAASLLSFFLGSFRFALASKARDSFRPPQPTGAHSPSPAGTGPRGPAPARADEGRGGRSGRSPSKARPRGGPAATTLSGRPDTLTTTGRRAAPDRGIRGGAGPDRIRLREARNSHQRRPARDAGGHSRGRPAGRAAGGSSRQPADGGRHLSRAGRSS